MAAKRRRAKPASRKPAARPAAATRGLRATPPGRLRRDTPREVPAVQVAAIERPETIEAAYEAWDALRLELKTIDRAFASERDRLSQQGSLLLGAVQTVVPAAGGEGLLLRSQLDALATEAREGLAAATADLERRAAEARRSIELALAQVVGEVRARVVRQCSMARPKLELMVRVLPGDRRMLHARRLAPDAAVTCLFALSGRIPTRYGYLVDDSTDDVLRVPPVLYFDEGIADVRPGARALTEVLLARDTLWPVKGMAPMQTSLGLVRWLGRGAVLEAEVNDGDGFRSHLAASEAEQVLGALLRLKLEGRLELELVAG